MKRNKGVASFLIVIMVISMLFTGCRGKTERDDK